MNLLQKVLITFAAPSSPSHQRKLLYASRGLKSGSVDLPDEVEKSLSSASTSPCPSPVRHVQVPSEKLPYSHSKLERNLTALVSIIISELKDKLKQTFLLHAIASVLPVKVALETKNRSSQE